MIQRASENQDDELRIPALCTIENLAETYFRELKSARPEEARVILEKANALLAKTLDQSRHVMNMIQHFRAIDTASRDAVLEANRGSVYDSVYQVLRAMQYEFPMEKITILKILPRDLPTPQVPSSHLEAILFQLLYNAREAVGDVAGIVTIEASERLVLTPESKGSSRIVLRVSDTGPGIPDEYLSHLYDPLFAVQNPCRVHGIGLSMVKRLVDHSAGTMRVETSLMGTSYYIEFSR